MGPHVLENVAVAALRPALVASARCVASQGPMLAFAARFTSGWVPVGVDCDTPEGLREWLLQERSRAEAIREGSRHRPAR